MGFESAGNMKTKKFRVTSDSHEGPVVARAAEGKYEEPDSSFLIFAFCRIVLGQIPAQKGIWRKGVGVETKGRGLSIINAKEFAIRTAEFA